MSLTTYCEFNEVRSALGVNELELKDSVLGLPIYEMGLVRELNKVSTSLTAAFSVVAAKQASQRSEAETSLFDAVRLFSAYTVAKQAGVSLANFALKSVSDGKASMSRPSGEPFDKVMNHVETLCGVLRTELASVYAEFVGSSSTYDATQAPAMFRASTRLTDVVTGS